MPKHTNFFIEAYFLAEFRFEKQAVFANQVIGFNQQIVKLVFVGLTLNFLSLRTSVRAGSQ